MNTHTRTQMNIKALPHNALFARGPGVYEAEGVFFLLDAGLLAVSCEAQMENMTFPHNVLCNKGFVEQRGLLFLLDAGLLAAR